MDTQSRSQLPSPHLFIANLDYYCHLHQHEDFDRQNEEDSILHLPPDSSLSPPSKGIMCLELKCGD